MPSYQRSYSRLKLLIDSEASHHSYGTCDVESVGVGDGQGAQNHAQLVGERENLMDMPKQRRDQ